MHRLFQRFHYFTFIPLMHAVWIVSFVQADKLLVFLLGILLYYPLHSIGTVIGYHKLLSHRSFEPRPGVMIMCSIVGMISFSGHPLAWAATHRLHHKYADTDRDPHSPTKGRLHAYYTWVWSYEMPEADKFIVKDLVRQYPWMISLWAWESVIPAVFYAILFSIDTTLGSVFLFAALLSWHKGMLLNTISHDPKSLDKNKAINMIWMARLLSPTFLHHDHHQNSNQWDYSTLDVRDYSAWFIDRFLKQPQ